MGVGSGDVKRHKAVTHEECVRTRVRRGIDLRLFKTIVAKRWPTAGLERLKGVRPRKSVPRAMVMASTRITPFEHEGTVW
jgi:hypothetical protein